ncbi:MAG: glycerol-3-phosphate acyltransferase [Clostridia bacterium]|nr:glycerol-3-phosphate acyltransferase [Clostridia bacterium]
MNIIKYIIIAIISYLLGNISSGVLIARAFGIKDIRKEGSGNAGTTNVLRTIGWLPSVLTLAGDCLKGMIACLIGKYVSGDVGMLLAGLCVTLGHDFPSSLASRAARALPHPWA